jgi:hypothetical protein
MVKEPPKGAFLMENPPFYRGEFRIKPYKGRKA